MKKLKKPFLFFLALLLMMGLIGFTTHVFADDEDTEIQTSTEVATDEQDQANDTDIIEDNTENKALIAEPQAVDNSSSENLIRLDLNVILDGTYLYSFPNGLNADVYINDQLVETNVNDFNRYYADGTKYKFILHPDTTKYRCIETEYQGVLTSENGAVKPIYAILYSIGERKLTVTGDEGIESIQGNGNHAIGTYVTVTYTVKPGYHITKVTGDYYTESIVEGKGGLLANNGEWANLAGKTGTVSASYQVLAYDRTLQVHTEPDKHTITIDPNGGTYKGNSDKTSEEIVSGTAYELNEIPVRQGYTFQGWELSGGLLKSGQSTGVIGNPGGNKNNPPKIAETERTDSNGTPYTNYSLNYKNDSEGDAWPNFQLLTYSYELNHTYQVEFDIRINVSSSGFGNLHIRHGACVNDYASPETVDIDKPSGWEHKTMTRIFDSETLDYSGVTKKVSPTIELYTTIIPGSTGVFDFDIKNVTVYDVTAKKYVSSLSNNVKAGTTVEMGDSDATVTAVWEPVTYTNIIYHWAWGFENKEGNNEYKNAFLLGNTCLKRIMVLL